MIMPRVFAGLAVSELILLTGTAAPGLGGGGSTLHVDRHILLAVFSLLLSCLIQVIVFTYLTVTGKMIAQAVHLGDLGREPLLVVKRLKQSQTHMLAWVVGSIVVATATGAHHWRLLHAAAPHVTAACLLFVVHVYVYYRQYGVVVENGRLVTVTLQRYTERREGRGIAGQGSVRENRVGSKTDVRG